MEATALLTRSVDLSVVRRVWGKEGEGDMFWGRPRWRGEGEEGERGGEWRGGERRRLGWLGFKSGGDRGWVGGTKNKEEISYKFIIIYS